MAQQPNVELTEGEKPVPTLQPGPAVKWRADKPGVPKGPSDVPKGGLFGAIGPDPGWATKLVNGYDLPGDDPRLGQVVIGLVMARAAALGRAAVPEDIEVALVLLGYSEDPPKDVLARRDRWLDAVSHDRRPGQTAVAEVDRELIVNKPEQIRWAMRHTDKG